MSPLESPFSLAQSIISYSTATTTETDHGHKSPLSFTSKSNSNSNASSTSTSNHSKCTRGSDVEAVEYASPVSSAARSEMTGTSASIGASASNSHSSETVSEYTQELVGIGLGLNSCTSDEDYQDTTTCNHTPNTKNTGQDDNDDDDDSGDDDADDDDDSNLNASYIVHKEYVPYGRNIDIDSGDDGDSEDGHSHTSSEDNKEHGYRVKETFEHYETSDREESGYESPMAVEESSSGDDTEDEDGHDDDDDDGFSEHEEDGTSLVQEALILSDTESGDEDSAIAVEIVNDEINHLQKSPQASASKEEYSSDEDYDNNDDFESVSNDDSECTARETISKRSYSHMVDTQQTSHSHASSSCASKPLQRQHSNTSTNTLISANKSKSSIVRRGKWTMGSRIGQGSFGIVHVGMNNITGKLMAVKSLNIDISCSNSASRQLLDDLRREIDLMKSFNHTNIVRYFGCEMDSKKQVLHIFQEWVPGGSVASLLHKFGPFPLAVVRSYLHQILIGLKYLHDNHVLHRDIKGGNVLVNDEGIVKLADFGASKCTGMHVSENGTVVDVEEAMSNMTMRGTPYFMAPEVFEENYGRKADVWSCACVAHQMCTSNPPWKGLGIKNPMKLFLYITKHEGPPPMDVSQDHHSENSTNNVDNEDNIIEPTTSDSLLDLLHQCFHRDPSKRPSVQKLLQHSFFTEDDLNDSLLEDESLRGGSVIGSRSITRSPLSPFSPLKLMDLKRSRVSSSMKKVPKPANGVRAQVCDHADWPTWAKPGKETDIAAVMKSNPFGM